MPRFLLAATGACALLLAGAGAAPAQISRDGQNRWMTVNNFSGNGTAINIYIMPAGAGCCWSQDLLGSSIIPAGRSSHVNFDDGTRACVFDIRITSDDRRRDWILSRIDVCTNTALNLR